MDRDEEFFDVEDSERGDAGNDVMEMTQDEEGVTHPERTQPSGGFDVLEKCGRWLLSIPRDDIITLRQTDEYHDFLRVFGRLGQRHRQVIAANRNLMDLDVDIVHQGGQTRTRSFSFLQHLAVDDVILRVFEYLECHVLVRTSATCSRFRELANRSAIQRTHDLAGARQLNDVMKLLRAKEQIDGVGDALRNRCGVPVPMLGLSKRVVVNSAGDPEYNGVYFCTGCNGNGFVFTKPRCAIPQQGYPPPPLMSQPLQPAAIAAGLPVQPPTVASLSETSTPRSAESSSRKVDRPFLRCIIAKRFSNETILWYMSKEVQPASEDNRINGTAVGEVSQAFSFWAKLMVIGEASPDLCRYPSPTSILSRGGDPAWQPLTSTVALHPPTVELLD